MARSVQDGRGAGQDSQLSTQRAGRRIAVVIPCHDSLRHVDACLRSLESQGGVDLEVVVVDNASTDGTATHIRAHHPRVSLLELPTNVGYGGAVNVGADTVPGTDVLALNVDTRLPEGCLATLARTLARHPDTGVVAPRLKNPDGTLQLSLHRLPTLPRLLAEALLLDRAPTLGARLGYHLPASAHRRPSVIGWATGAALLVRREAWDGVGGFDPEYFFFVEEIDLQRRIAEQGWAVRFEPGADVMHEGGKRPLSPDTFLCAHDGFQRFFTDWRGSAAGRTARAILCLTALTRWLGWRAVQFVRPSHPDAAAWARMFGEVGRRSVLALKPSSGSSR